MKLLTRDEILNATDFQYEEVEVPEWGGAVRVKSLSGIERDRFEDSIFQQKGKQLVRNFKNFRAKLVSLTVVDGEGKRMFTEKDVDVLGNKSAAALDKVFSVAQRLSGLTKEDVDELTKNSETVQSEESISD